MLRSLVLSAASSHRVPGNNSRRSLKNREYPKLRSTRQQGCYATDSTRDDASFRPMSQDSSPNTVEPSVVSTAAGDPLKWNNSALLKWVAGLVYVDDEKILQPDDLAVLQRSRINGSHLPTLTVEKLERIGLPFGPAESLVAAVRKLLGPSYQRAASVSESALQRLFAETSARIIERAGEPKTWDYNIEERECEATATNSKITKMRKAAKWSAFRLGDRDWQEFVGEWKNRVGQFITVPYVHTFIKANLQDAPSGAPSFEFLLTPQRVDLIVEFLEKTHLGFSHQMILSGPDGVSKSSVIAVLAAFAFFNDFFLLYIPDGKSLASSLEQGRFVHERAQQLNEMHYDKRVSGVPGVSNVFQMVERANKTTDFDLINVFNTLTTMGILPVVIIDELEELCPDEEERKVVLAPSLSVFIRPLSAANMILVVAGSAHSEFEAKLQSSLENALRYLVRLTNEQSMQLIFRGDLSWIRSSKHFKILEDKIMISTGGIPRELISLSIRLLKDLRASKSTSLDSSESDILNIISGWHQERVDQVAYQAQKFLAKREKRNHGFIRAFTHELAIALGTGLQSRPFATLWDQGLFIKDGYRTFNFSSGIARDAYVKALPQLAVDPGDSDEFEGSIFLYLIKPTTRWIKLSLRDKSNHDYEVRVSIPGSSCRVVRPQSWDEFPDPLLDGTRTVFAQPSESTLAKWPTFDFFVHWTTTGDANEWQTHYVLCIQVSISTFSSRDTGTAEVQRAFTRPGARLVPEGNPVAVQDNWMAKVISSITNVDCDAVAEKIVENTVENTEETNLIRYHLDVKPKLETGDQVKCFFVYATSSEQESIAKYRNIALWNKKTLTDEFDFSWTK